MTEPVFTVPLSALIDFRKGLVEQFEWCCKLPALPGHIYPVTDWASSKEAAVEAAIEHLATAHNVRPVPPGIVLP